MADRSKRHHHVPQCLLRKFCDPNLPGQNFWYSQKDEYGNFAEPEKRSPKGAFWEKNLNTTIENDVPTDTLERTVWGPVDDALGNYIIEFTRIFGNAKIPVVAGESLIGLREIIGMLIRRNNDFMSKYDPKTIGSDFVESVRSESERLGVYDSEIEEKLSDKLYSIQIGRHIKASAIAEKSTKISEKLQGFYVCWARSTHKSSFIIGSYLVQRVGNGGETSFDNEKMELLMPIDPKTMLLLTRDKRFDGRVVHPSREQIRSWNDLICSTSREVASHSELLLKSLTGRQKA